MVELRERYPVAPPSEVRAVQGWMALDIWCALGRESADFDPYIAAHGWAETWAWLCAEVRRVSSP